jgi:hypothetical protein
VRYNAPMETDKKTGDVETNSADPALDGDKKKKSPPSSKEVGGRDGPDPTRFGDWEKNGRCIDF